MTRSTLVLLIVLVVAIAAIVYAQAPPSPGEPMGPRIGQMPPVAPLMIYEGERLFILRGDQVIKINAATMEVMKVTMLPRPEMPRPPTGQ